MHLFEDRRSAGRRLAERLACYAGDPDVVVLALPCGGVPVGYEIAVRIGAPLDVLVVRSLGVPGRAELAMGAVASGGIRMVDQRLIDALGISRAAVAAIEARERGALERCDRMYHAGRPPIELTGRTAILVDDGATTGGAMAAAIGAVRSRAPRRVIAALPVALPEVCDALGDRADEMICLETPVPLYAVDAWYEEFPRTSDAEIRDLLAAAPAEHRGNACQPREART